MALTDDLAKIVKIDESDLQQIISILSNPDNERIDWAVQTESLARKDNKGELKSLLSVLDFVASNVAGARNYKKAFDDLNDLVIKLVVDEPEAIKGWSRIKDLLDSLQAFFLIKKESNIKDRFNRVTDFLITVDSRPIFDMDRNQVIKTVYPFILKIESLQSEEGFTCEFYEDMLDDLISELNSAKQKLKIIKG